MVDASTWSDRIDGTTEDPFALQEGVARAVAAALDVQITAADEARLATRPVPDPRAADCARRAIADVMGFTREGLERAEALARQGLGIVGDNAQLFTALGMAEFQWVNAGFEVGDPARRLAAARDWIDRALQIDPDSVDAHFAHAWIAFSGGDVRDGFRRLHRSLARDATHANSLALRVVLSFMLSRVEALRADLARLEAIDPFDVWGLFGRGIERQLAGDRAGRDAAFARAVSLAPGALGSALAGLSQAVDGDYEIAEATLRPWADQDVGTDFGADLCRAAVRAFAGDPEAARALGIAVAASPQFRHDPQWGWMTAQVQSLAGLHDEAVMTLERAVACGLYNPLMLGGRDATLQPLHHHPRYQALVQVATRELASIEAEFPVT